MGRPPFDLSLYLVTDRALSGERGVVEVVRRAIAGGVTLVQLREPQLKAAAQIALARQLLALLRPAGIPLIINDRVDVALAVGADGVHVGQEDMGVAEARRLLGPDAILGLSITSLEQLRRAALQGVDYLGVGPLFATATKPDHSPPIGPDGLRAIVAQSPLPVVAIGGLSASNAALAIEAGAAGVAIVSAICAAPEPELAARELKLSLHKGTSR